jgi:hypothetical protein
MEKLSELPFFHEFVIVFLHDYIKSVVPCLASEPQTSFSNLFCCSLPQLAPNTTKCMVVEMVFKYG